MIWSKGMSMSSKNEWEFLSIKFGRKRLLLVLMKKVKFIKSIYVTNTLSFLLILFCFSIKVKAQDPSFIDSLLVTKMNEYQLPGLALGIVKDDEVYLQKGYGVTDINSAQLVDEYNVFHTGSVSKLFTAQAILALVESGLLDLETSLGELNLELRKKNSRIDDITVRQLLEHQSGLPDLMGYDWKKHNIDSLALEKYFTKKPLKLKNQPGAVYHYSNIGYDLLALIVQKVSGQSFESYAKETVLLPNNMILSDFRYFEIPDQNKVSPHTKNLIGRVKIRKTYPYTREHAGSSTLNANVVDLNNWMINFMNDPNHQKFLKPSQINKNLALGFQLYPVQEKVAFGHYGGDKGFRSFLMMEPAEKIGIVILSNSDFNEDFRQEIVFTLYDFLKEE
jgi:CubicO group peptidase (beta-lactamase class C family)